MMRRPVSEHRAAGLDVHKGRHGGLCATTPRAAVRTTTFDALASGLKALVATGHRLERRGLVRDRRHWHTPMAGVSDAGITGAIAARAARPRNW